MKLKRFWIYALLCAALLAGGCTTPNEEVGLDDGYGYVQFKLFKKSSYQPSAQSTRNTSKLEWHAEAYKVRVVLEYGNDNQLIQTLTLSSGEGEAAEWGLRSNKLKLLTGTYALRGFELYDAEDRVIYNGAPESDEVCEFTVIGGGLVVHDITVNVTARGKVHLSLVKDMEDFVGGTRAVSREYTFDEISKVNITVRGEYSLETYTLEKLPCKFDVHYDQSDEVEDGYKTSSITCDTLLWMPVDTYKVVAYETFSSDNVLLEKNTSPKQSTFTISDNKTTEAQIAITLREADSYIQDYYALKEIWESLNGESWYYIGEEYARGSNWNFNKDVDLWGDQPGVKLHSNGRVALIDISNFGFSGNLSPAIGQLSELTELYLGTHNDTNYTYDPTLDRNKSIEDRTRNRMKYHGEWLRSIHTPVQLSEPCARALAENNISIAATKLYESMSEQDIIDPATGAQRNISLMDSSHGALCNGLKSLPKEIGNLTKLEYLYIANSQLEALPEEMVALTSLTDFELHNCPNMKQFPMVVADMPNLVSMNIANNAQWSSEEIYKGLDALAKGPSSEKVQILYCRQNNLRELPESFKNMKKIGLLDLAYNKIEKVHPLGKEVSFVQLYLDHNLLEEIPADQDGYFCGYDDVETFSVSFNRLKKVPNIFDANSTFTMASVDFSGNQIDGFEGEENGTYKGIKVETFTLSQNKFKAYPKAIAESNSTVAYIILRANEISEVPKGVFTYKNSVNLTSLDLSYNNISKLPWDMHAGNLPYLYGVDVSFNSFSEFPYEPLDSSGLTVLAVRSQRTADGSRCLKEWPTGIGNHRGLRGLYLGSNDLRVVDDSISTLIYYLDIADNPNIIFDATDICYAWSVGAYILIYDKSQNILNCSAMIE